jgi:hypothetical protein
MVTTLAAIIGSMGGSWLAFDGVLAEIFGMVSQFKLFDLPLWEIELCWYWCWYWEYN